jgi:hypothetical protein
MITTFSSFLGSFSSCHYYRPVWVHHLCESWPSLDGLIWKKVVIQIVDKLLSCSPTSTFMRDWRDQINWFLQLLLRSAQDFRRSSALSHCFMKTLWCTFLFRDTFGSWLSLRALKSPSKDDKSIAVSCSRGADFCITKGGVGTNVCSTPFGWRTWSARWYSSTISAGGTAVLDMKKYWKL